MLHSVAVALAALVAAGLLAVPATVRAADALVAVAANFADTAETLKAEFEAETSHTLTLTTGATGTLYAQARKGAPYDVLLAADRKRPAELAKAGEIVPGSRFTYAVGRLSLWSRDPARLPEGGLSALDERGLGALDERGLSALDPAKIDRFAIANPALAPYGRAAREALRHHGLWDRLAPRLVRGQNVGQAFSMIATGNAELGLVATAQAIARDGGGRWDVPAGAHAPIRQDAVRLRHGRDNAAAEAFTAFLRSPSAHAVIERFGYRVPSTD